MNISYEDYYKLCNYTNIDLTDESYLEDEERLRYIISKIKVKNPKKYFKEEDGFKVTKEIFEENKEDLIFMKYILNKLNVNSESKTIIEGYLACLEEIEFDLRDFEIELEKMKEIHLKYLKSFKDKTYYNVIRNFLKNNPDFLSLSSCDDEVSFMDNEGGLTYTCFNKNFVSLSEDDFNDYMLSMYIHEMQHVFDLENGELNLDNLYYELKSILTELYLSDYVKENYDEEYGFNIKLYTLSNELYLLYEIVLLSDLLNKLINKNPDTIGWIKVLGTDINYPVVQTNNNDFYLTHSFDKSYNKAGWIFADYINKNLKNNELDKNTIIYGHNRQNNSMFGTLSNVFKEEWLSNKENHYINFSTLNNNMVWEVFSTYTIEKEEYYIQSNFSSDEEYISFLNTIKNRSTYKYDVNISKEDKILTLSTCTNVGKGRTVLHAKLIYRK